ncbi:MULTISPECIES: hypothetical protein [Lacticaseibacillus]|uniref:hypothetical protein n=1 Tax=Lacticaseibacillus TaxID=2759736 RepID=UPI00063DA0A2|nr:MULTISPECIES: hypothetical protein [Lacticaseibacillus]KLI75426.1 hypothetical protein AAW28_07915 [Lacticaseibacillus casei]
MNGSKSKKPSLNQVLKLLVFSIIAVFIIGHATPSLAVRTQLVMHGYVGSALFANVQRSSENAYAPAYSHDDAGTVYYVKPSPVSKEALKTTDARPNRYAVQTFVLSFATMTWDN